MEWLKHIAPGPPQVLSEAQWTRLPSPQHSSHEPTFEQAPPSGRQHWPWPRLPIVSHAIVPSFWQHCSASVQFACGARQAVA